MREEENKPSFLFHIFGRDPFKIPCFAKSIMYGVGSYVGVGAITFLTTSKARISSHCGMASFVAVTTGYFSYCRYQVEKKRIELEKQMLKFNKRPSLSEEDKDKIIKELPKLAEA